MRWLVLLFVIGCGGEADSDGEYVIRDNTNAYREYIPAESLPGPWRPVGVECVKYYFDSCCVVDTNDRCPDLQCTTERLWCGEYEGCRYGIASRLYTECGRGGWCSNDYCIQP